MIGKVKIYPGQSTDIFIFLPPPANERELNPVEVLDLMFPGELVNPSLMDSFLLGRYKFMSASRIFSLMKFVRN